MPTSHKEQAVALIKILMPLGMSKQALMGKARYLGLGRNRTRTRVELVCVAHNNKRGLTIRPGQFA